MTAEDALREMRATNEFSPHIWADAIEAELKAKDAEIERLRAVDVDAILKVAEEMKERGRAIELVTGERSIISDWKGELRKACGAE